MTHQRVTLPRPGDTYRSTEKRMATTKNGSFSGARRKPPNIPNPFHVFCLQVATYFCHISLGLGGFLYVSESIYMYQEGKHCHCSVQIGLLTSSWPSLWQLRRSWAGTSPWSRTTSRTGLALIEAGSRFPDSGKQYQPRFFLKSCERFLIHSILSRWVRYSKQAQSTLRGWSFGQQF